MIEEKQIEQLFGSEQYDWIKGSIVERINETKRINLFRLVHGYISENILSAFLASLLDSRSYHGMGIRFVQQIMEFVRQESGAKHSFLEGVDYSATNAITEWTTPGERRRRIDIVVQCLDARGHLKAVFGIEHKIGAGELPNQVSDYQRALATAFRHIPMFIIYLTRDKRLSATKDDNSPCYAIEMGYIDLVKFIENFIAQQALHEDIKLLLQSFKTYLSMLSKTYTMDRQLKAKVQEIFLNESHRETIRFIYENFPNGGEVFSTALRILQQNFKEKSYIFKTYQHAELKIVLYSNSYYSLELILHCPDGRCSINSEYTFRLMFWVNPPEERMYLRANKERILDWVSQNPLQDWASWVNVWAGEKLIMTNVNEADAYLFAQGLTSKVRALEPELGAIIKKADGLIAECHARKNFETEDQLRKRLDEMEG
ncbi:MAG TPA: PD-(D/E)XK nuclease family protein [Anaerovoracaceae bacterium]|nr:PD-(D/E)XK nuclease family protein [Anaerovoracaceae bacterium]